MSEETTTEEMSDDKEQNLAALRAKAEALEAQLAALQPLAVEKAVRSAGFDPDTPAGRALARLTDSSADAETVKSLAAELGFEASTASPKHEPTKEERAAQEFADRTSRLNSVTTSDTPLDIDGEIAATQSALNAARAAKNWDEVRAVGEQLQQLNIQKMRASVASHV